MRARQTSDTRGCSAGEAEEQPVLRGLTSRSTWALIAALFALVGAPAVRKPWLQRRFLHVPARRQVHHDARVRHPRSLPEIAGARTWLNQQWLSQVAFYTPDLLGAVMRLQIGAVIAHVPAAIARLERIGFRAEFTAPGGIYLVRQEMRGA